MFAGRASFPGCLLAGGRREESELVHVFLLGGMQFTFRHSRPCRSVTCGHLSWGSSQNTLIRGGVERPLCASALPWELAELGSGSLCFLWGSQELERGGLE